MKRLLITIIVIVAVGAAGWFGFQSFQERRAALAEVPSYETVTVERGSISSTVSATGSIEPEAEVSLSFRASGRVEQVLVAVGQPVEAEAVAGPIGCDRRIVSPRTGRCLVPDQPCAVTWASWKNHLRTPI